MKWTLGLLVVCLFAVPGCGGGVSVSPGPPDRPEPTVAPTEPLPAPHRENIGANAQVYERNPGSDVAIAILEVKATTSTEYHRATGNGRFVWVHVSARNFSMVDIVHVNPNDFTLETLDGYTVSHDSDTYSLSNYFDAVNLRPGAQTSGWLIFYVPGGWALYTLNYQSLAGSAQKAVVIPAKQSASKHHKKRRSRN